MYDVCGKAGGGVTSGPEQAGDAKYISTKHARLGDLGGSIEDGGHARPGLARPDPLFDDHAVALQLAAAFRLKVSARRRDPKKRSQLLTKVQFFSSRELNVELGTPLVTVPAYSVLGAMRARVLNRKAVRKHTPVGMACGGLSVLAAFVA